MSDTALSLKRVSKSFGDKKVLKQLDFSVPTGTIMGLVGKNGAGKTTLIKCLLGLLKPEAGEAKIFNDDSWDLSVQTKHRIGYVPQVMTGFRWMKVKALLEYTGAFYTRWNKSKVQSLLVEWELNPDAKISTLSEGERQKLSIILAMGHEPDLYIFDEPVASLDPAARRQFIKYLIDLNISENKTMLFSTHITSDLERVAADISLLKDGGISYIGDLSSIKDRIRRVHFQSEKELPSPLPINNVLNSRINGKSATVTVDGLSEEEIQEAGKKMSAFVTVEYLNLEEIFLELNK
ncbi:ABC transporter ATP-binding protein [candidate division KSB1 bacterium]